VPVDIRLIAATNKNLPSEIEAGTFRQDLYFRLNIVHLTMPSLREIRADIPLLATSFLHKYSKEMKSSAEGFTTEALNALSSYNWPGNVRELENEVKRVLVLSSGELIGLDDLSDEVRDCSSVLSMGNDDPPVIGDRKKPMKDRVAALETKMIQDVLTETEGDRRRTAKLLGLSHQGLINKIKRYGLD